MRLSKEYSLALAAVLMGLLAGAVLMLLTGNNPVNGYINLFRGGLMNVERIGNTLASATPLVFTGLSVAFAFKTGLFNIGAAGQMLIGGLCATAIGLTFEWPKALLLTAMIVVSLVGGGLWAALPGWLKARFNVHEVVATIMMNWIAYWTVFYVVPRYLKGPFLETESARIPYGASLRAVWLTEMFDGSYINLGLFLAAFFALLAALLLDRTTLGFELKAVGFNRHAAEAAGINVSRSIIVSMTIAGALAGVAGVTFYAGYASNIQIGVLPVQGFDGIAVSLLGANTPLGVAGAALFFGLLHTGKGFMSAMTRIPPEIADTIIATVIYFAAAGVLVERTWSKLKKYRGGR
jgi:simple sugar transport system permease protein